MKLSRAIAGIVLCVAILLASLAAAPGSQWKAEHSGQPYVGVGVHYALPAQITAATGTIYVVSPSAVGHPRAATVLKVYDNQRADLAVTVAPDDIIGVPGFPLARGSVCLIPIDATSQAGQGELGSWHWPPDPADFRTTGR